MAKKLFIAATGQHVGKTTCTLGLVAALKTAGYNVGYCKPVGQKHLMLKGKMADKDTVLFENILQFEVEPEIHSPVVIASGVTSRYIKKPEQYHFAEKIRQAMSQLEARHDVIIFEGTGHAGVGSIIKLSNAQVASMLEAEVIMVAEGGIGSAFDRLNLNLALFREQGVPIKGVIINKVHPDKYERVEFFLRKALKEIGVPVLGLLPYDRMLSFPLMSTVKKALKAQVVLHPRRLNMQVEEILAGSSIEIDEFTYFRHLLLIVNKSKLEETLRAIEAGARERNITESPLSGIVLTNEGRQKQAPDLSELNDPYILKHRVPVLTTSLDTYDAVVAISRIEVKINTHTPWKVNRAIELIHEHVPIQELI
ncbi:MAG: hypothetical protein D6730_22635 [Bacteroidetes bacterium]|nr:MAG: hypothetical protein D6730_22635 [Bacteroidota bacterium]